MFKNTRSIVLIFIICVILALIVEGSYAGINDIKITLEKDEISSDYKSTDKLIIPINHKIQKSNKKINSTKSVSELKINMHNLIKKIIKTIKSYKKKSNANAIRENISSRPTRIGEPKRIDDENVDIQITKLPEGFSLNITTDATEKEYIQVIMDLYKDALTIPQGPPEDMETLKAAFAELEEDIKTYCMICPYPYLNAMARFYMIEIRLKALGDPKRCIYDDFYKNQELYDQIINIYASTAQNNTYCKAIVETAKNRKKFITKRLSSLLESVSGINAAIASCIDSLDKLKGSNYEVKEHDAFKGSYPNDEYFIVLKDGSKHDINILNAPRDVIAWYKRLIQIYCWAGEFNKAEIEMGKLRKIYEEYKGVLKITMVDVDSNGDLVPTGSKQEGPFRNTAEYLDCIKTYMHFCSNYGEVCDANTSEIMKKRVSELINEVNTYQLSKEYDLLTSDKLDQIKSKIADLNDNPEIHDNYYNNSSIIQPFYFTKTENIEISSKEIVNPFETICIRSTISSDNAGPLYVVSNLNVKSNVSNRTKTFVLKRDWFYGGYYTAFQANEDKNSNDKTKNLIKKHGSDLKEELQQSICVADFLRKRLQEEYDNEFNPFRKSLTASFIKYVLGKGVTLKRENEALDVVEIDENILNSMGFESLSVELKSQKQNVVKYINIKNSADWFVMEGHYNFKHGFGIERFVWPINIKKYFKNELINFSNCDTSFAVFSVCALLAIPLNDPIEAIQASNGIYWRKKTNDNTVIMSYLDRSSTLTTIAIAKLIEYVEKCGNIEYKDDFKINIAKVWNTIHKELYYKYIINALNENLDDDEFTEKIDEYNTYVIKSASIYKDQYYYLEKHSQNIKVRGQGIFRLRVTQKPISKYLKGE